MRDGRNNPQRASTHRPEVSRPTRDPAGAPIVYPLAIPTGGSWGEDISGTVELNIFFTQPVTLDSMVATDWVFNSPETGNVYGGSALTSDGNVLLVITVFAAGSGITDGIVHYINNGDRLKGPGGVPVVSFDEALDFGG